MRARVTVLLLTGALGAAGCSSGRDAPPGAPGAASSGGRSAAPAGTPAEEAVRASSTNLEVTPLSAADYAMYASVMAGASALLANLSPDDRKALELAEAVDTRRHTATAVDEPLLAAARALQHKDEELADLQGVGARYRDVKSRVARVIGPGAQAAANDDAIARENRRFLEPHRANIERLQRVLRDPLSRPRAPEVPLDAR
jgi:hypothetical protein